MRKVIVCFVFFTFLFLLTTIAQVAANPNEGDGPGGGAPIGGSFMILLSLGIGYSFRKIYDIRKKSQEENQ
jgi:hypothetical protein